jgi:hypothetical protein
VETFIQIESTLSEDARAQCIAEMERLRSDIEHLRAEDTVEGAVTDIEEQAKDEKIVDPGHYELDSDRDLDVSDVSDTMQSMWSLEDLQSIMPTQQPETETDVGPVVAPPAASLVEESLKKQADIQQSRKSQPSKGKPSTKQQNNFTRTHVEEERGGWDETNVGPVVAPPAASLAEVKKQADIERSPKAQPPKGMPSTKHRQKVTRTRVEEEMGGWDAVHRSNIAMEAAVGLAARRSKARVGVLAARETQSADDMYQPSSPVRPKRASPIRGRRHLSPKRAQLPFRTSAGSVSSRGFESVFNVSTTDLGHKAPLHSWRPLGIVDRGSDSVIPGATFSWGGTTAIARLGGMHHQWAETLRPNHSADIVRKRALTTEQQRHRSLETMGLVSVATDVSTDSVAATTVSTNHYGGAEEAGRSLRRSRRTGVRWRPTTGWSDSSALAINPHGFEVCSQEPDTPADDQASSSRSDVSNLAWASTAVSHSVGRRSASRSVGLSKSFESVFNPATTRRGQKDVGRPYVSRAGRAVSLAKPMITPGNQPVCWALPENGLSREEVNELGKEYLHQQKQTGPVRRAVLGARNLGKQLLQQGENGGAVDALVAELAAIEALPSNSPLRAGRPAAVKALVETAFRHGAEELEKGRCTTAVAALAMGLDWVEALPPTDNPEYWRVQFFATKDQAESSAGAAGMMLDKLATVLGVSSDSDSGGGSPATRLEGDIMRNSDGWAGDNGDRDDVPVQP